MKRAYLKQDIYALEPIYLDNVGSVVRVTLASGQTVIDERRMKTVLKQICMLRLMDYDFIRQKMKEILPIKSLFPIPIGYNHTLLPIKMRTPRVRDDGAYGYVQEQIIHKLIREEDKTLIYLKNDMCLSSFDSLKTITIRRAYACTANYYYQQIIDSLMT